MKSYKRTLFADPNRERNLFFIFGENSEPIKAMVELMVDDLSKANAGVKIFSLENLSGLKNTLAESLASKETKVFFSGDISELEEVVCEKIDLDKLLERSKDAALDERLVQLIFYQYVQSLS